MTRRGFSTRFAVIAAGALALLIAPALKDASAMPRSTLAAASQGVLPIVQVAQSKKPKPEFMRKKVRFLTDEKPGTIIVDTSTKYLYYVEGNNRATRYGVGVGREGFGWSGTVKVGRKAEWPDWRPPASMIARERRKGRKIPHYMKGGINNPLGARALYLYRGGRDTIFRIHGTNQPWTIGQNMSSGCIRMMNKDVKHLYKRAGIGSKVIVIGPNGRGADKLYTDRGMDFFGTLFGGS
ncbi:L,D-transpeptidase-like protein [Hoeflea halophila]|uniref:L,D-transpeptidase-like protein n=1 Tax=Hoeflea halophila TaxID=714899 RepID=A0A286IE06_9HYPH|nr:L,D-transpeptidase [Hoeflea halophila]SOE18373.1 L,D-transpeptidase-like protein [Hoeflea halophila]